MFPEMKKNFGFGCMRLPMKDGKVDNVEFSEMVDKFIASGFNYFDTAHGYLDGKSEIALRECLTSRYPREAYLLADKLSPNFFKTNEDIRPFFESQLRICGVEYFDFYLMHAQSHNNFQHYIDCRAYETAFELKKEGKIRHVGLSFHDSAAFLDQILSTYPDVEFVQLQFNYLDYGDDGVQAGKCYEVCKKHGKPVIVMEPVKGGALVRLPDDAQKIYDDLNAKNGTQNSNASYAIRFAAGFENIVMVLSGMGSMEMMNDNVCYMSDFRPLSPEETDAVRKVCAILRKQDLIPCTACRYCTERCPHGIPIPGLFSALNEKKTFGNASGALPEGAKASDCLSCGACEDACPQHLPIRELLKVAAKELDA